jgi:hypothetical protein
MIKQKSRDLFARNQRPARKTKGRRADKWGRGVSDLRRKAG